MTITHTLSRIVATDTDDLRYEWSDGYSEVHAPDWTGFMRGSTAGHGPDGEWERIDGTEPFNAEDKVLAVFLGNGGEIEDYVAPPVIPPAPHLNGSGLARFTGIAPSTILENIRMSGVTRVAKGRYRVTHTNAMPSDQYSVTPSVLDINPRSIRTTARTASYVEVRVIDAAGASQDAAEITVKTERVVTS